ncbi:hypothetical protein NNJEOMEG_03276 [Fundidesulfovibrio magnetotacticus]|uniref:Metallo-beta-lactamase domain-containing protein n=1 Tax=Fundidesulfovibrio magnetotacticus TaxID=2730080 RepID=A0A6V8LSG3_9BACT|nr:MBL fold metallo-hydrolase [Fundidesulfovibrio magnetotacticus]GFK95413.1 hypothetical protein NNJEOMEG_03276 [Fundidesulfovibrio magnetotacticus]
MAIEFLCNIWKVEHGSAAFVKTPNNKHVIFDAGRSDDFSPAEYLHKKGVGEIDVLFVSHPHNDHVEDLPNVMSLLKPLVRMKNSDCPDDLVYPGGKGNLKEPMKSWLKMEQTYTQPVTEKEKNWRIKESFGGVEFNAHCVAGDKLSKAAKNNLNNYSVVVTVQYRGILIVFPGDLEPDGWDAVLAHTDLSKHLEGNIKILIAPHHGRRSGIRRGEHIYDRFLKLMKPDLVIISDVWGNESTDPEAYRGYCAGLDVECGTTVEEKKVLTTKTNNCVSIQVENDNWKVKLF